MFRTSGTICTKVASGDQNPKPSPSPTLQEITSLQKRENIFHQLQGRRNQSPLATHLPQCHEIFFFFVSLGVAIPVAYGGSQARDLIGAVAADLCQSHSNVGSEPHLWTTPQLRATPDPYQLIKARDRTRNLMIPSWIRFYCTTTGISE